MKISPLVIESIDTNTVDLDSCWLWSSSDIYNPDYSSVLAQPVSIEIISLNDLRWKAETTTLTLRWKAESDSAVAWSGYVELFPEPNEGTGSSTELQYYTGVIDATAPVMIDNPDGSIYMSSCNVALNTKPDHTGDQQTFLIQGKLLTPVDGLTSYVAVRYNSGNPEYYIEMDPRNLNGSDVAAIYAVWRVGTEIHSINFDSRGIGLPNKTAVMLTNTRPYNLAYGQSLVLSERSTPFPRLIGVTAALVYAGVDAQQVLEFDSIVPGNRLTKVYHVAGVWTYDSSSGAYDNLNYDNGTDLVSMSGINKYSTRWFYRTIGDDRQVFYICGNEYNTVHAAQQESIPTGIPTVVQSHAVLLGRIIIQYGSDSGIVENVVTTSFNTLPVLNHNGLDGLQGTGPDYYHLDADQYAMVTGGPYLPLDGSAAMTGDMTSQSIRPLTNTTYDLGSSTHRYNYMYSSILNTTGLVSGTSYIGSIIPYNNESFYYDIGTNLYRYNRIYAKDITINGFSTTASSIDIGAGYRINLSGYLSSQPQINWPTNYSSSVVAGDMSWDGTKLKVGDGTVQRVFAYTSDITSQSLSGFSTGSNTAIVQSDSILQAFQKTQGQINARALTSDLGNYLPKVNPTYTGRLTGPEQYLENDGQILLSVRRPGGFSGRIHGIAFQAQTLDGTWVDFGRVTSYISSVADGAQIGGMRLYSYNAGSIVTALDAGPTSINIGSGLTLQMNGTTVIDASRNATLNLITAAQATIGTTGQESVILRRPGATTNLLWGLDFQGQTADLTWVNYSRVQSRIVSTANGAQTGYLRLVNYNAGTQVNTVEVAPTYVDFATGVVLRMAGSQLVDTNKNITMGATLTLSTGAGTQANVIFRSSTEHWTSFYVTTTEAGFRDYNADGSSNSYPIYWTLKSGGILRLTRITNMLQGFQINGTTCVDASRNATFVGLVATGNPVFGTGTASASVSINGGAGGSAVAGVNLQNAGVARASMQVFAGTAWRVVARNTSGGEIDSPFYVDLAVGGKLTLGGTARTTNFKGAIEINGAQIVDASRNISAASVTTGEHLGISGTMASSESWRVLGRQVSTNDGYLEIATADANTISQIYVRQYTGTFASPSFTRTLTLLDGSGNTVFPGTVSAPNFSASANGTGENFRVGDDLWIGDANISHTAQLKGFSDPSQAYLKFGTGGTKLGWNGSRFSATTDMHVSDGTWRGPVRADRWFATSYFQIIGTTSHTSWFANGTGEGSPNLPANYVSAGKRIVIEARIFTPSCVTNTAPEISLKIGSVTMFTQAHSFTVAAGAEIVITVRATLFLDTDSRLITLSDVKFFSSSLSSPYAYNRGAEITPYNPAVSNTVNITIKPSSSSELWVRSLAVIEA